MIICERCQQDLAMLKTVDFVRNDLHFTKCVFGYFNKVEISDALTEKYSDDSEFIEIYLEIQKEELLQSEKQLRELERSQARLKSELI